MASRLEEMMTLLLVWTGVDLMRRWMMHWQGWKRKHRTVFILRFKMNLSIKEIAEICEISDGTVKSRIFYCLKKLSGQLAEFNPHKQEVYG